MNHRERVHELPLSIAEAMRAVRTKSQLAKLLQYLRIRPRKSLGQNFLVDHNLLKYIVRAGEVGPRDVVLDIGCGTGLLAAHLADAAGRVIGIELDRGLFTICSRYLEGRANVTLLCGDALASKHALSPALLEAVRQALREPVMGGVAQCPETQDGDIASAVTRSADAQPTQPVLRVVSNLPYSAASLIVPNLLESGLPIAVMVVTVQKEVARRMVAAPGSADYGALSLMVQAHAHAEIIRHVPPEVFWPRPKVDSCIVRIWPEAGRSSTIQNYEVFRALVRAAFAHRRKTLANSLAAAKLVADPEPLLTSCGIPPAARAQDVDLAHYILLANRLSQITAS